MTQIKLKYVNRELSLSNLIDWAEDTINEANLESGNFELLRNILARIGLADVREFGLSWDGCYEYLNRLGYDVRVEVSEIS